MSTNMMEKIKVSRHAKNRLKQRLNVSSKDARKCACNAYVHGTTHKQTTGELHAYMNKAYLKNGKANNMRIYKNNLFLFSGYTLITVFTLPENLQQHKRPKKTVKKLTKHEKKCLNAQINTLERALKESISNPILAKKYQKDIKNLKTRMNK